MAEQLMETRQSLPSAAAPMQVQQEVPLSQKQSMEIVKITLSAMVYKTTSLPFPAIY